MITVLLLLVSNTFMTFAWYGHLKYRSAPLVAAVVVSWLIAFGEYCFQVPANRLGYRQFSGLLLPWRADALELRGRLLNTPPQPKYVCEARRSIRPPSGRVRAPLVPAAKRGRID